MFRFRHVALLAALLVFGSCADEEPPTEDGPLVIVTLDDQDDVEPESTVDDDESPTETPGEDPVVDDENDEPVDDEPDDVVEPSVEPNEGWIGGTCDSANDCDYDGSICVQSGSGGACSLSCDGQCPDRDGENSVTFCMNAGAEGRCVAECDTGLFGFRGCRDGYECQVRSRFGDRSTTTAVCVPDGTPPEPEPEPIPCLDQLDMLGVNYRAWSYTTQYADGMACTIDDPIYVSSPINGISYRYYNESSPDEIAMSCELAVALHELGDLLSSYNVVEVEHLGTFNCRKISGTNSLSMHGLGLAIDFYGFTDSNGDDYILERDWEHDTDSPTSAKGQMLYQLAIDMYQEGLFNIILTPNFNAGHDNHFHVDLTPGALYIGSYYSPYDLGIDCGN